MQRITNSLYNWASILEPKTRGQACETAALPFIYPHMALMPDAHLGRGATVGSVIPTLGAIIPAAVGVDIGCGMVAVRTGFTADDLGLGEDKLWSLASTYGMRPPDLRELHRAIANSVPLSAGGANPRLLRPALSRIAELEAMPGIEQAEEALPRWRYQLGTLGSGNHFIEVSLDEEDRVWAFLHSGSRGVGNRLASKHIAVAQRVCADAGIKLVNRDLAYLTEGTAEFDAYIEALRWAQHFALLNRAEMMDRTIDALEEWIGVQTERVETIGCHHNYTEREVHYGREVWLSRKGAISAKEGQLGLIPGSMGDRSYVVRGLGNREALCSAPHGAGRNYSRSAAKREFTREDLDERMAGITWGESDAFLDEHPLAYKPIDQVMKDASELVEVVHELRQFVNVKGN
jgi:tRNA-splicing ligase RtcB